MPAFSPPPCIGQSFIILALLPFIPWPRRMSQLPNRKLWQPSIHAAAELDDALLEDWGWQIATLAQAIKAGLEQIVQRQIPRVLGIEAADPGILAFLEDNFDGAITALSEENISHVLDATTAQVRIRELGPMVGHLPWRSNVGFGSVYDCFTPTPDEQSATWAEVEKWLSEDRPAWWFHVWLTAVNHPRAIPPSAWPTVWLKLGILLGGTIDGFEREGRNAALYATLFQFYSYRLESSLPTARSDFIFWCASRLASDVVSALSQADADVDVLLSQAFHDAKIAWHVASPSFAATSLRSAFLSFHSYWPSAVQSSVSDWFTSEAKEHIPEEIRQVLVDLVRHMCLRATMLPHDESGTTSSLVIGNLSYVNEEWKEVVGQDEISHLMSDHRRLVDVFSTPDSIVRKFLEPILEDDIEGLVAFFRWCNYVRSGYISMDQAIDVLTSDVWIDKVEPSLKPELLDSVVAALLGGLWTGRETLRVEVSHWSARRCLAYLSDNERRSLYCAATVLFSLKSYTASAITRLVYEDKLNALAPDWTQLRDQFARLLGFSPAWVAGRIRSVLAVLEDHNPSLCASEGSVENDD